jgi:hypothetical protein
MTPKTTPKDFFLHLGAVLALYISAGALINLAFSIINYAFPDALAGYFTASSIVWPISILVILVPILYALEWLIGRDISGMPEKKNLWVRRWRIYLTIFLTIALIGGDLIVLINTYLNGEVTARFVWKIVAILLIAGSIGKYYFFSIYEKWKHSKLTRRVNAWFGVILVLAAIIGGFCVVGSPATQRALRFDQQRVSDLQNIQWQILSYWQAKGKVPAKLDDLKDSLSYNLIPVDPETKKPYVYLDGWETEVDRGANNFELCATFNRESRDDSGRGSYPGGTAYPSETTSSYPYMGNANDSWSHKAGYICFRRSIDLSRYPVNQKIQGM